MFRGRKLVLRSSTLSGRFATTRLWALPSSRALRRRRCASSRRASPRRTSTGRSAAARSFQVPDLPGVGTGTGLAAFVPAGACRGGLSGLHCHGARQALCCGQVRLSLSRSAGESVLTPTLSRFRRLGCARTDSRWPAIARGADTPGRHLRIGTIRAPIACGIAVCSGRPRCRRGDQPAPAVRFGDVPLLAVQVSRSRGGALLLHP